MKLFNKTERKPAAAENKQQKVKNPLLQTYFTSLLCMMLCVAMFLSTSYAWFTSEVNNAGNEIYIGILDVGLYKKDGQNIRDLADSDNKLFDRNILWEPGYTTLETVQVVNEGDLAFKYFLNFTDGVVVRPAEETENAENQAALEAEEQRILRAVAESFDIWVYDHQANQAAPQTASYGDMIAPDSGWEKVGTLAEVLGGKAVLSSKVMDTEVAEPQETVSQPQETTAETQAPAAEAKPTHTYTIALHMQEGATLETVMGKRIALNVKLVAYQMSKETDAFNNRYDRIVTNLEELKNALKTSGTVALAADIDLSQEQLTVPADASVVLDLNGHKLTATVSEATALIENQGNLTINGDQIGSEISIVYNSQLTANKAVNAISNRGKLTINSGKISNTGIAGQIGYAIDNYSGSALVVNGGQITATGSGYYDGIRLFCSANECQVTVNGGKISSIWAQNPTANKATEVNGTVVVCGGQIGTVYYERYTTVKVAAGVEVTVTPYGEGKENVTTSTENGYTVHSFVIQ